MKGTDFHNSSEKGQSLLEIVIVMGLVLVIVTALAITTMNGLKNSQFAQNQLQATKLAQEGLEKVRTIKYGNCQVFLLPQPAPGPAYYWFDKPTSELVWNGLRSDTGTFFMPRVNSATNLCQLDAVSQTSPEQINIFSRYIYMLNQTSGSEKSIKVVSEVHWTDYAGDHTSRLATFLADY